MSFQIILTYTKEDPLVDWFEYGDDVQGIIDKHKANGNIEEWIVDDSDALKRIYKITFKNAPASLEFNSESVIEAHNSSRELHSTNNQIIGVKTYGQ